MVTSTLRATAASLELTSQASDFELVIEAAYIDQAVRSIVTPSFTSAIYFNIDSTITYVEYLP